MVKIIRLCQLHVCLIRAGIAGMYTAFGAGETRPKQGSELMAESMILVLYN